MYEEDMWRETSQKMMQIFEALVLRMSSVCLDDEDPIDVRSATYRICEYRGWNATIVVMPRKLIVFFFASEG